MDIYCSECGNNIGLQTNEDFNSMWLKIEQLEDNKE